jgi:hypothetical protein
MTKTTPNIDILKKIATLNIDLHFSLQKGNAIFGYSGDVTPEFVEALNEYRTTLSAISSDIDKIINAIPVL